MIIPHWRSDPRRLSTTNHQFAPHLIRDSTVIPNSAASPPPSRAPPPTHVWPPHLWTLPPDSTTRRRVSPPSVLSEAAAQRAAPTAQALPLFTGLFTAGVRGRSFLQRNDMITNHQPFAAGVRRRARRPHLGSRQHRRRAAPHNRHDPQHARGRRRERARAAEHRQPAGGPAHVHAREPGAAGVRFRPPHGQGGAAAAGALQTVSSEVVCTCRAAAWSRRCSCCRCAADSVL